MHARPSAGHAILSSIRRAGRRDQDCRFFLGHGALCRLLAALSIASGLAPVQLEYNLAPNALSPMRFTVELRACSPDVDFDGDRQSLKNVAPPSDQSPLRLLHRRIIDAGYAPLHEPFVIKLP